METYLKRLPTVLRASFSKPSNGDFLVTQILEYYFGIYAIHAEGFAFPPGDKKLLLSAAKFVNSKTLGDPDFFAVSESVINCSVEPTPIGNLYCTKICSEKKSVSFTAFDEVALEYLVDVMKKCLSIKLNYFVETIAVNFPHISEYLKLDNVELRTESVSSMLKSFHSMRTTLAVAIVKCSCSARTKNLSVHFKLQDKMAEIVSSILQKKEVSSKEMDKMKAGWIISNLQKHHNKKHNKPNNSKRKTQYTFQLF